MLLIILTLKYNKDNFQLGTYITKILSKEEEMANDYKKRMKDYLEVIDTVIKNGSYKDDWESLENHPVPKWYQKAKFGIFIHWGVFSVPAYHSEWYPFWMYRKESEVYAHHIKTYGEHKQFGYKDFVPMFKNENYNPEAWVKLFKEAGARFVMPVAEHCDGFPMYDCSVTDWCAKKKGPCKDMLGMLQEAAYKEGLKFAASSHRVEHCWFMSGVKELEWGEEEIPYGHMYWPGTKKELTNLEQTDIEMDPLYMEDWLVRNCEIVDKYRPSIMYFDWWIQVVPMKPYLKKFAAYYYNRAKEWGIEVTINFKNDAFMYGVGVPDIERGQLKETSPMFWQNDTAVAKNSWCYTEGNEYKKPEEIICDLIDVVSKNGSLLLNVGPKCDGTFDDKDIYILKEIGKWLKINGEGIYDSTYWKKFGEGPTQTKEGHHTDILRPSYTEEDFRFTFKHGHLYVFCMKWPKNGKVRIKTLGRYQKKFNADIKRIEVLNAPSGCTYTLEDEYLEVVAEGIQTSYPVAIKLTMD